MIRQFKYQLILFLLQAFTKFITCYKSSFNTLRICIVLEYYFYSMIDIWIRTITLLQSVLSLLYSNTTYEFHGYTIKQIRLTYPSYLSYKDSYNIFYNPWLEFDTSPIVTTKKGFKTTNMLSFYQQVLKIRSRVNHNQNRWIT